jgi:hypothetical protein
MQCERDGPINPPNGPFSPESLPRPVFFNRLGEIRDRFFENQRHRASGLNRVVAAITLWNTVYLARATEQMAKSRQFDRGEASDRAVDDGAGCERGRGGASAWCEREPGIQVATCIRAGRTDGTMCGSDPGHHFEWD